MKITIQPSRLSGHITAPASKSSMQRACAAALLVKGESIIKNPGHSNDDKAALDIIIRLGAEISKVDTEGIAVRSNFLEGADDITSKENTINCGESGLSIRMFTPIAALCANKITITGEGSLLNRPLHFFDEVLPQLGVQIASEQGKLPITVQGPLQPASIEIDGSLSSQFLTGLLFAYAASHRGVHTTGETSIRVNGLKSRPYIDLTLDVMKQFGLPVPENRDYKEFIFHHRGPESHFDTQPGQVSEYTVEGDWSGGAFLLVAGAIAGNIMVRGLSHLSTQADKKIIEALMDAQAGMAMEAKGIRMHARVMKAFEFDATDCPDLFPPLVALAAYCDGISTIKGVSRLAYKESNRGITLQEEFGKMGVLVELSGDLMQVHGGGNVKGAAVHSRHDHRIAMACAVAALGADGTTSIAEAGAVDKSYPDFFDHLESLGATVSGGIDTKEMLSVFKALEEGKVECGSDIDTNNKRSAEK